MITTENIIHKKLLIVEWSKKFFFLMVLIYLIACSENQKVVKKTFREADSSIISYAINNEQQQTIIENSDSLICSMPCIFSEDSLKSFIVNFFKNKNYLKTEYMRLPFYMQDCKYAYLHELFTVKLHDEFYNDNLWFQAYIKKHKLLKEQVNCLLDYFSYAFCDEAFKSTNGDKARMKTDVSMIFNIKDDNYQKMYRIVLGCIDNE